MSEKDKILVHENILKKIFRLKKNKNKCLKYSYRLLYCYHDYPGFLIPFIFCMQNNKTMHYIYILRNIIFLLKGKSRARTNTVNLPCSKFVIIYIIGVKKIGALFFRRFQILLRNFTNYQRNISFPGKINGCFPESFPPFFFNAHDKHPRRYPF